MAHGPDSTSVASLPNGSFVNVAFVEGDDEYTDWMEAALLTKLVDDVYDSTCPSTKVTQLRNSRYTNTNIFTLQGAFSYMQRILGTLYNEPAVPQDQNRLLNDPTPLSGLIAKLKNDTQTRLDHTFTEMSVSFPDFFTDENIATLRTALEGNALHDNGCHGSGRSPASAMVAQRQAEFGKFSSNSTMDMIYGPFGIENVIHIEHTESVLVFTPFQLFIGQNSSWVGKGFRAPIYLVKKWFPSCQDSKSAKESVADGCNNADTFWSDARACFEKVFEPEHNDASKIIYRFLMTGTLAHDPRLLQSLRDTPGVEDLLPSSSPIAIQIYRDPGEISRKFMQRHEALVCTLPGTRIDYGLWERYERDLLTFAQSESSSRSFSGDIDPVFAAARGAALYSLESQLKPCHSSKTGMEAASYTRWPFNGENEWVRERSECERRGECPEIPWDAQSLWF
ncbi:MAG: hypothetical protein Q9227_007222 [Pyrenula ochraceoflavens]